MRKTQGARIANCSVARALNVFGDRWSMLILREAHMGVTRYVDFKEYLGISTDVLAERLHALVSSGLLEQRSYHEPGTRLRFSYHLTEAGEGTKTLLAAIQQWGDDYRPRADGPTIARRDSLSGGSLSVAIVSEDGRLVPPERLEFKTLVRDTRPYAIWESGKL
jgi:DNA-binding HxlR family transcriptional regulator